MNVISKKICQIFLLLFYSLRIDGKFIHLLFCFSFISSYFFIFIILYCYSNISEVTWYYDNSSLKNPDGASNLSDTNHLFIDSVKIYLGKLGRNSENWMKIWLRSHPIIGKKLVIQFCFPFYTKSYFIRSLSIFLIFVVIYHKPKWLFWMIDDRYIYIYIYTIFYYNSLNSEISISLHEKYRNNGLHLNSMLRSSFLL